MTGPLAELHLHLEGSVTPETLLALDSHLTREEVAERYSYDDFLGFLKSYGWVNRFLRGPAEYGVITRRLLHTLERQQVTYVELNLSVGVMLWKQQDPRGIIAAVRAAAAESPVEVRYIFDAVRQFALEDAWRVAELAVELGAGGFGLGGDEGRGAVETFAEVIAWARAHGLHFLPHAGETGGAGSIWKALELGAERIGHGIQAVDDPELVKHLAARRIPLEISITSNLRTGAAASLTAHPLRRLWEAGVPVTLNTDDPGMFHTTLTAEYELARNAFGFGEAELRAIADNAFRYAMAAS